MTAAAFLLPAVLCLTLAVAVTVAGADLVFTGCVNSYIRLQCPSDDTLIVHKLGLTVGNSGLSGPCAKDVTGSQDPPPVPRHLTHLCVSPTECFYEDDICKGKNDCAFYIGMASLTKYGLVQKDSVVNIVYSCQAGFGRIGGLVGICIVTAALVVVMAVAAVMICRSVETPVEDESKYVEFENRLSRSGSMSSEINAKIKDKKPANLPEADRGAEGGVEEAAVGGNGVKISTSF